MYLTIVTCPVCATVFDLIRHEKPESNGQSVAMLAGDGRRFHRDKSPECATKPEWSKGWNTKTCPITETAQWSIGDADLDAWITWVRFSDLRLAIAFGGDTAISFVLDKDGNTIIGNRAAHIEYGMIEGNKRVTRITVWSMGDKPDGAA